MRQIVDITFLVAMIAISFIAINFVYCVMRLVKIKTQKHTILSEKSIEKSIFFSHY